MLRERCGLNDFTDTRFIVTKQRRSHSGENVSVEVTSASIASQEADVHELDLGWFAGNLVAPSASFDHVTSHVEKMRYVGIL